MIDETRQSAFNFIEFLDSFEKIGTEIERLVKLICDNFIEYLNDSPLQFKNTEPEILYGYTKNDFFINSVLISFPIIQKRNRTSQEGYINFIISLPGEGVNQYDELTREPLIHVEFTLYDHSEFDNFFHHPIKRERYFDEENINNCKTVVENNIVRMYYIYNEISELQMFAFSLMLFSINNANINDFLFKPAKHALLKYHFNNDDIHYSNLDHFELIPIPSLSSYFDEIPMEQDVILIKIIDFISSNQLFTLKDLQNHLRVSSCNVERGLKQLLGCNLIKETRDDEYEIVSTKDEMITALFL